MRCSKNIAKYYFDINLDNFFLISNQYFIFFQIWIVILKKYIGCFFLQNLLNEFISEILSLDVTFLHKIQLLIQK